jgi:hypothetical protein
VSAHPEQAHDLGRISPADPQKAVVHAGGEYEAPGGVHSDRAGA